jgi:hypothetical protein
MLGSGLPPDGDVMAVRVGDLGCLGVDIAAFEAKNRVPMVTEGWNVWIVNRTLNDNPSVADMTKHFENVFEGWFPPLDPLGENAGRVDNITVTPLWGSTVNSWQQHLDPAKKAAALQGAVLLRSRSQIPDMVTVESGPTTQLAVRFVYRGTAKSRPWPVWSPPLAHSGCPVGAKYALEAAYRLAAPPPTPPEKSAIENILDKIPNPLDNPTVAIGTALVVTIAGGLLVAYIVRSVK